MVINERNEVAVIIAKDYNSQWFTNHQVPELITDDNVVRLVQDMQKLDEMEDKLRIAYQIERYCDNVYGERTYYGDTMCLGIVWVPAGAAFNIIYNNYQESIVIESAIKE